MRMRSEFARKQLEHELLPPIPIPPRLLGDILTRFGPG